MKVKILNLTKGILITILWSLSLGLFAQNKTINGKVTDNLGESLIGVTVQIPGTNIGTVTDINGNFMLTNVPENAKLEISYVGMRTQIVEVDGRTTINITLLEDTEILDEVVVVAYGTQKARSVTGAMSRINTDEVADMPVSNITQKMQGKFAGFRF